MILVVFGIVVIVVGLLLYVENRLMVVRGRDKAMLVNSEGDEEESKAHGQTDSKEL